MCVDAVGFLLLFLPRPICFVVAFFLNLFFPVLRVLMLFELCFPPCFMCFDVVFFVFDLMCGSPRFIGLRLFVCLCCLFYLLFPVLRVLMLLVFV